MVQRCLQLSLRIGTKLRALPGNHPLQAFCRAATRNVHCGNQHQHTRLSRDAQGQHADEVVALPEARGRQFPSSVVDGRGLHAGSLSDRRESKSLSRRGSGNAGEDDDFSACRRYSEIVAEVVSLWCRDPDTFDLDPMWLLQKLKAHRNW